MNKIKRGLICLLTIIIAFSFIGCSDNNKGEGTDTRVLEAIEMVGNKWTENYNAFHKGEDKHLEIVNTRVINIKDEVNTTVEYLKDLDYVVEFVILTNEQDMAPHYVASDMNNSVYVYKNGDKKVYGSLFESSFMTGEEFSAIIDSVEDSGSQYNRVIEIN